MSRQRTGWLPFQVAIVTVVVGLLVVTCGFLVAHGLYRGQRSVELLKRDYLDQVVDSAVREVFRLPLTAVQLLRIQRYRIETRFYATDDPIKLGQAFAGVLQADSQIQWVSYGEAATGRFVGAHRVSDGDIVLNSSDPRKNGGIPREVLADTLKSFVGATPLVDPYDPRTREWFRKASSVSPGSIVWMPPYTFAEGIKGITAASAARDTGGQLLGVVTVDFAMTGIAEFLETIKLPSQGAVTLFTADGQLLAGAAGHGLEAAELAVAKWSAAGSQGQATTRRGAVNIDGDLWNVVARSTEAGSGLEWTVAVAVPDEAFMGPVYANRRSAIAISLGGIVLAVLGGVLLASGIGRALRRVTSGLDRVARFELDDPVPARSKLREIAQLEAAAGRVTASLRSFSRYAPEEVVRDVVVTGREAMLSGEKREVTVLFSDLRGFTSFAERIRPEEVVAILNDHFDLLVEIIARHGGFVVDFLGDSAFAVFGAPRDDADHLEHAVSCAIEMQQARAARNQDNKARNWPPMEMGVGIDTGAAIVGNMGSLRRIKYGVVSHVVNTAARIESLTVGGQVLVSDAARQGLADRLVADGPLEASGKGVEGTMRLWEVLALRGDAMRVLPSSVRAVEELPRPLDAEMRLFLGKQIDRKRHPARIRRLGAAGAEFEPGAPLAVFDAVQVLLPVDSQDVALGPLDGKVIALTENEGIPVVLVRFTGLDWETQARVDAFAGRARAAAVTIVRPSTSGERP